MNAAPLNIVDEQEWVDPTAPPAFEDVGEALDFMDEVEAAAIKDLEDAARERMAADAEDPSQQSYFFRVDRQTVVKDEAEYVRCQLAGIPMKVIPYSAALQALKNQDARKRQEKKAKKAKKTAKKSRAKNR